MHMAINLWFCKLKTEVLTLLTGQLTILKRQTHTEVPDVGKVLLEDAE